jgi:hypothetical protein
MVEEKGRPRLTSGPAEVLLALRDPGSGTDRFYGVDLQGVHPLPKIEVADSDENGRRGGRQGG